MIIEITNWWLDGEISDENYINSLNILSGKSSDDKIIPNGIFQDSALLILAEPQNDNDNGTLSADTSLAITKNFDDLNASIVGKHSNFSSSDEKIFLEWLETKASSWRTDEINDNEFISEVEKVLDSSKVGLYLDYLDNLSVKELISKAVEFEKAGKFRNALSYYDRAVIESFDSDENEIKALVGKGSVLNSLGQYGDAMEYFDNVLEMEPDNISALKKKAFALAQLGQVEEARDYFEIATQIELQ
jgi:tetratricopeptide (TPR) repeat protein